tara:strand:+ start:48 stop:479 length:432 start_codon:yes stop_codon:yes gene_type:complete
MLMDILGQLGMNFTKEKAHDAIDGIMNDWEKSRGFPDELMGNMSPEHQSILGNILEGITTGGIGSTLKAGRTAAQKAAALGRKKWWLKHNHPKSPTAKEMLKPQPSKYKSYDPEGSGQYIESGKEYSIGFLDNLFDSLKGKEF